MCYVFLMFYFLNILYFNIVVVYNLFCHLYLRLIKFKSIFAFRFWAILYMKKLLYLISITLLIASCSPYQKLLKSNDSELKYTKSMEYYESKQYLKLIPFLRSSLMFFEDLKRVKRLHLPMPRACLS